jgi:hypothetical protein
MTVEERARQWMEGHYDNPRVTKYNKRDDEMNPTLAEILAKFAEAERRATITACLEQVAAEIAHLEGKRAASPDWETTVKYQNRIWACERIATRLKQLEEQK